MKYLGIGLAVLLAAAVMVGCGGDDDGGYESKTVQGITLSWKINGSQDSLLVKVSATTVGMVLVGFDIDPLSGLQNANIITGYVVSDRHGVKEQQTALLKPIIDREHGFIRSLFDVLNVRVAR